MRYLLLFVITFTMLYCQAQNSDSEKIVIKVTALTDNVIMLEGSGGQIGVVKGDHSLLVIDAQFEPLYDKIKAAISEWSSLPVEYLLNTHWHNDHTDGNEHFSVDGATIIAHQNVKSRLSSEQKVEYFNKVVPALPETARPRITFSEMLTIQMGEEQVNVIHLPNAHTDGDAIIHLPKSNVIHMGDTYFSGMYPFIDISTGGNIKGIIKACELVLSLSDEHAKIICGHGPLSDHKDLQAYTAMLKDITEKVETAKNKGLDLKAIVEMNITAPYDQTYNVGFVQPKDLIAFVYYSL